MAEKTIYQKLDIIIDEYTKMFKERPHTFGVDELLLYERIKVAIATKKPLKDMREQLSEEFGGKPEEFII